MTEIQTYTNAAFGSVRILYEDGKPLFCGADACKALGYKNQHDALTRHCKGVVKRPPPYQRGKTADELPPRRRPVPAHHPQQAAQRGKVRALGVR